MNADSNAISLVGHDFHIQQLRDNQFREANDEASTDGHNVEPSTLSEAPVYEAVSRVYQLNDKMEHDEHVYNMVKKQIKTRIWPYTKFSTVDIINETECYEEGNYLHLILTGMNLLSYNRVQRVRFWLRYGKVVLEVLSVCKCNVASGLKKSVVQRK